MKFALCVLSLVLVVFVTACGDAPLAPTTTVPSVKPTSEPAPTTVPVQKKNVVWGV